MKTKNQMTRLASVVEAPTASGYNVTLINDEGSCCSTQIWGGHAELVRWVSDEVRRGLDDRNTWDRPYVAAFIKPHGGDAGAYEVRIESDREHAALVAVAEAAHGLMMTPGVEKFDLPHYKLACAIRDLAVARGGNSFVTVRGEEVQLGDISHNGTRCGCCTQFCQFKPGDAINPESRDFGGWCLKNEVTTAPELFRCGGDDFERRAR